MAGRLVLTPGEAVVAQQRAARGVELTEAQIGQLQLLRALGATSQAAAVRAGASGDNHLNPLILGVALVPKGLVGRTAVQTAGYRKHRYFWITPAGEAWLEARP